MRRVCRAAGSAVKGRARAPSACATVRRWSLRGDLHDPRRRRPGIHQPLRHGLDPEVESLEAPRPEPYEVTRLAEDDLIRGAAAADGDEHTTGPSFERAAIGLTEQ